MKKNTIIVAFLVIVGVFSFLFFKNSGQETFLANVDLSQIRPEVKIYIDELYNSEITSVEYTTDGIEEVKKMIPSKPERFDAGRFQVVFNDKNNDKKVMIFQTEEKVGHYSLIIPGETDVGGFVEIQKIIKGENIGGVTHTTKNPITHTTQSVENQSALDKIQDSKLNDSELDYLIRMLYKKFDKQMTKTQADYLNSVKDYALAIQFSDRGGIDEYHSQLVGELKD